MGKLSFIQTILMFAFLFVYDAWKRFVGQFSTHPRSNAMRPGFLSTEFYVTVISQVLAFLVLAGFIAPADKDTLQGAIVNGVTAIVTLIASVTALVAYIKGRMALKAQAEANAHAEELQVTDHDHEMKLATSWQPLLPEEVHGKAEKAGIPIFTLVLWALRYGPDLVHLIDDLIAKWKNGESK